MTSANFTHLHVHSEFSMLDAISPIPDLVARARDLGMTALAITDHGAMYGAVSFYTECKEQGINPIIGCEVYVAHASQLDRGPSERSPAHLTLLAQDDEGYRNLIRLVTKANIDGFYYRPRVDLDLLAQHQAGIVCLSGCPSGALQRAIKQEDHHLAAQIAGQYHDIFAERYFLEIQRHQDVPDLGRINTRLIALARETGIPLVATSDSHYVLADQHEIHRVYTAIQTDTDPDSETGIQFKDPSYHLASPAEMSAWFPDLPQAIDNAYQIGQSCHIDIGAGQKHLPEFPLPAGKSAQQYLTEQCMQGFHRRCPDDPTYRERLEYELGVVQETQFADYFLIVWDIIHYARQQGMKYSVRGSAAASLVLYCLDITNADPMTHRLVFERFLNPERKEMPDIDIDFQDDRRDEIIRYTTDRYGSDHVAQIITFNRYGAKSVVRAVARARNAQARADELAQAIPLKSPNIAHALANSPRLTELTQSDPQLASIIREAQGLEGTVHHTGQHPAGIVIAAQPVADVTPLQRASETPDGQHDAPHLTQYGMDDIAKLGLLKMDFLSLTNLTILDHVQQAVPQGPQSLADIPLDDPETYRLLSAGHTSTVFQLESSGMQRHIKNLKPSDLGDISAMIALYRPGPMEHIERFIGSKHGRVPPSYPHPSMKDILDETYGIIVYQDQVLQILQTFAGYSMGEADVVRKAMGKKIPSLMQAERERFLEFADRQGQPPDVARQVFDAIEPFAGYAFNKAHSISYALISYWTAWYKAHHTAAYMTAVINCRRGDNQKVYLAISECHRLDVRVLNPCVNTSQHLAAAEGPHAIRLGLQAIHGLTDATATAIIAKRGQTAYQDLTDFCKRAPRIPPKQMEMLIKAGALDPLAPRPHCLQFATEIANAIDQEANTRESGQINLFDLGSPHSLDHHFLHFTTPDAPPDTARLAAMETEALGMPLSRHLKDFLSRIAGPSAITSAEQLAQHEDGGKVKIAGIAQNIRRRTTREGKPFLTVELQLADGPIELMVWSELISQNEQIWTPHAPLVITGKISQRDQGPSVSAETARALEPGQSIPDEPIHIHIVETDNIQEDQAKMQKAIMTTLNYPGTAPVYINIHLRQGQSVSLLLETVTAAADNPALVADLTALHAVEQPTPDEQHVPI